MFILYLLFLAILQIINISFDFFLLKKGGKSSDSVPLNEEDAQVDIIQNEQDCQHTVHYHPLVMLVSEYY